jgi:hypothetical protein
LIAPRHRQNAEPLHRGPGDDRSNPELPAPERTGHPCRPAAGTSYPSPTKHVASFRGKRIDNHNAKSARMPLKTAWHGLLRAIVQE